MVTKFEVGDIVRAINMPGVTGIIYAIRPGQASGTLVHSVRFERPGKNPSHGFYYDYEIFHAENSG